MYQSLTIENELLDHMAAVFTASRQEEGFLLGCSTQLNHLTHGAHLAAADAGLYHYTPDTAQAHQQIHAWADAGICFCGFIHSHVANQQDLSEADLEFAEALIRAYKVPLLWFGLAVISDSTAVFRFYSLTQKGGSTRLSPVSVHKSQ